MITEEVKTQAIARLRRGFDPTLISEELGLPDRLVREWQKSLDPHSLLSLEANLHAADELANGRIVLNGDIITNSEELLRTKLETVAVEIVDQTALVVTTGDIVRAKTLQLCADTVSKLYQTFITKGIASPNNPRSPTGMSAFQRLMKD